MKYSFLKTKTNLKTNEEERLYFIESTDLLDIINIFNDNLEIDTVLYNFQDNTRSKDFYLNKHKLRYSFYVDDIVIEGFVEGIQEVSNKLFN